MTSITLENNNNDFIDFWAIFILDIVVSVLKMLTIQAAKGLFLDVQKLVGRTFPGHWLLIVLMS